MIELTAAEIASLAFSGAVQATGGALSQTAIAKCKQLWQKIKEKFQGNKRVEAAIADAEQQKSSKILEEEIIPMLRSAMEEDKNFSQELQNIAQVINQEINSNTGNQTNISVGDANASDDGIAFGNINNQGGNINFSRDVREKK